MLPEPSSYSDHLRAVPGGGGGARRRQCAAAARLARTPSGAAGPRVQPRAGARQPRGWPPLVPPPRGPQVDKLLQRLGVEAPRLLLLASRRGREHAGQAVWRARDLDMAAAAAAATRAPRHLLLLKVLDDDRREQVEHHDADQQHKRDEEGDGHPAAAVARLWLAVRRLPAAWVVGAEPVRVDSCGHGCMAGSRWGTPPSHCAPPGVCEHPSPRRSPGPGRPHTRWPSCRWSRPAQRGSQRRSVALRSPGAAPAAAGA